MVLDPKANCNWDIPQYLCTLDTCCLWQSHFLYIPNYGANLFFLVFFAIFVIPQVGLGIWYRTWGFLVAMFFGLALEAVGYGSRIMIHNNPFADNPFLIYLITLTIAPVFIAAAIYLCLTRMIGLYGDHLSRFRPRTIAIAFMCSDFLSLVLQAIGGALADTASTHHAARIGIDIMIAGLLLQALSLAAFLIFVVDFSLSVRKGTLDPTPAKQAMRNSALFKVFTASLLLATLAILVRSIFRVAELWEGFSGDLWNNETDFLILDGAMIALATICLTVMHPGTAFGKDMWQVSINMFSEIWRLLSIANLLSNCRRPIGPSRSQRSKDKVRAGSIL